MVDLAFLKDRSVDAVLENVESIPASGRSEDDRIALPKVDIDIALSDRL